MAVLFVYIIQTLFVYSAHPYDGSEQGFNVVPHAEILSNEKEIYLNSNSISELLSNEFSAYTDLMRIDIKWNDIHTISPSAFSGTQLATFDISGNKLTAAPDLSAVSSTLKTLKIMSNPLTAFPNITMFVTNAKLVIQNTSEILESNLKTVCSSGYLYWTFSKLTKIPDFDCESSTLYYLQLQGNDLSDDSDLSVLDAISSSLQSLGLVKNKFTSFPNLPVSVRRNLRSLWLKNNQIKVISDEVISGYHLKGSLTLENNQITALPDELLSIAHTIKLDYNPLRDWDQYKWNKMICDATSLQNLNLIGVLSSLTQMPDIHYSICNRTKVLNLNLESIPGPCDCSLHWMADVVHQGCPVKLGTDVLQCGTEVQELNLNCPQNGMVLYDGDNFAGGSFMVDNSKTSAEAFQSVRSIAVLGEQAWVLHSSSLFDLSAAHKVLLPGRYANLQEAGINFLPAATEPYNLISSVINFPSEEPCKIDESLKLFDDDPMTYMSVQGVLQLTIASTDPVHRLMILTRDMDCTKRFHVSVSVRQQVNQCQKVDVGELFSYSYSNVNGSAELSECVYAVPQGDGDIMIRLAAVHKASVCSVTHIATT